MTTFTKMKPSGSSPQESLPGKTKSVWDGYDNEELPEMTDEQIASFRPISKEEHLRFKRIVAQGRLMGRPTKAPDEKEQVRSIRISDQMLNRIKEKADRQGLPWQTFIKKILADELDKN